MSRRDPQWAQTGCLARWRQSEKANGIGIAHHATFRNPSIRRTSQWPMVTTAFRGASRVTAFPGTAGSSGADAATLNPDISAGRASPGESVSACHAPAARPMTSAAVHSAASVRRLEG